MKPLDPKLAAWLKSRLAAKTVPNDGKSRDVFADIMRRIADSKSRTVVERAAEFATSGSNERSAAAWLGLIIELWSCGWPVSANAVAVGRADVIASLSWTEVSAALPTSESLEAWRRKSNVGPSVIADEVLRDVKASFNTAAADWVLLHATSPKPKEPVLQLFLERTPRAAHLRSWDVVLEAFFLKDPKGERLRTALALADSQLSKIQSIATVAGRSRKALSAVTSSLGKLAPSCGDDFPGELLLPTLFADIVSTRGKVRRQMCAHLTILAARLLEADVLSTAAKKMLAAIERIGTDLKSVTRAPEIQRETWIVQSLVVPESTATIISDEAANRWALVYERALQEKQPTAALEVLAQNLGLTEVGTAGSLVTYIPREHEDTEGGMLPGDKSEIVASGWSFNGRPLIRAQVRRPKSV